MKFAVAIVFALALTSSGVNSRTLQQQLPVLPPTGSEGVVPPTPTPAPAPSPIGPVSCALEYLVNAGNYNTLIELVEAASESAAIAQILDSPASLVTLLAPTDSGVQKTLAAAGLTAEGVLAQPELITQILTYHVLPSQLRASDLVDGYSFNTELVINDIPQSVTVAGSGTTATFVGAKSSAPISGDFVTACSISVIPIDGLLLPVS